MSDPFAAWSGAGARREETAQLRVLAHRLTRAAADEGLLDVAYRTLDTPIGPLLLAATQTGIVRVAFEREGFDAVLDRLAGVLGPRVLRAPWRLDDAAREVEGYLTGSRRTLDLPLDLRLAAGFRREVLQQLRGVEFGRTISYAALAAATGRPRAVRATGTACATNPLPLLIGCHRVIRSDGGIGAYLGGVEIKERLLALERG